MAFTTRYGVTLTYEVGLASNPSVAIGSTSWTDLSAYMQSVDTKIGRSSELDTFQAGTATFQLNNQDRRFDPNNASGPYTGNLKPMRRVRLRATYNAVTYNVWAGFVDGWPQEYKTYGKVADVPLRCTDASAVLTRTPLPESVYAYEVTNDTPVLWWRFGESDGWIVTDSSGNLRDGTYGPNQASGTSGLIGYSSNGAGSFSPGEIAYTYSPVPVTYPFTVECWLDLTNPAASEIMYVWQIGGYGFGITAPFASLEYSQSSGRLRAQLVEGANTRTTDTTIVNATIYHVVAVFTNGSTAPTLYINGTSTGATGGSGTVGQPVGSTFVGSVAGATQVGSVVDEFAIYSGSLSAARVTAHYNGGTFPWNSDTVGTRIGRYLDIAGWPSADRTLATGVSILQPVNLASNDALSLIRQSERSEQGQVYMDQGGVVVFRDRHWRFENSAAITSNGTFGDGAGELDYFDIATDDGNVFIANHVRAQRTNGALFDVKDSTSIGLYYERIDDTANSLDNQSDSEVRDLANWRLATRKNPIQRVTQLVIKPQRDPANLFPQVLARNIGDRLIVKNRPPGGGTANTYTVLIEGIAHSISPNEWTTVWYLSSQDSNAATQPLILDDTTYGLLDTNVLAY